MKKFSFSFCMYLHVFACICMISVTNSIAQVVPNVDWVRDYSEKDQIENVPSAIDANNNVYITGYTVIGGSRDFTTIKYNSSGTQQWVQHYSNIVGGDDRSNAIVIDATGNIYVTGQSQGTGTGLDYATVKYDANGVQQWSVRYNGVANGDDIAVSLAVDNNGNVFVTGKSRGTSSKDYATVKYNSAGVQQWVSRYNGTGGGDDNAVAIGIGSGNRVYVTGTSKSSANSNDIVTIRHNFNTGSQLWVTSTNGTAFGTDQGFGLLADGNDVVICGAVENTGNNQDYLIAKLNGNNGNSVFQSTYNGYGSADIATSIVLDTQGEYVVTGTSRNTSSMEYHTIKFNSTGTQQWVNKRVINQAFTQVNPKVATDFVDHIYVCGEINISNNIDMLLYQITPNGNTTWTETHNGTQNGNDVAVDLVMGNLGVIYLAGQTSNSNAKFDYTTIKYSQTPVVFPPDFNNEPFSQAFSFIQNEGQLADYNGQTVNSVTHYTNSSNISYYIEPRKFSLGFAKLDTSSTVNDSTQRIDISFSESNVNSKNYSFEETGLKLNYYLPWCMNGIEGVKSFKRLMIPNIYDGIDLHYFSNSKGIKYYFVVKPGYNPAAIKEFISGDNGVSIGSNGSLKIVSMFETTSFKKPIAYQINPALQIIPLQTASWNSLGGNIFNFNLPNYNSNLPLVIMVERDLQLLGGGSVDPLWSTFIPGNGNDIANDVTNDQNGNTYIVGETNSSIFPILGSQIFQSTNLGNYDAFAAQFDVDYELKWMTFYGGSEDDFGISLAYDNFISEKLYICGSSGSGASSLPNIPVVPGVSYQETSSTGGKKGMLVRLDALSGSRDWGTFFGGSTTIITGIDHDANGNFFITGHTENMNYVTSCTGSTNNFPGCNLPGTFDFFQPWFSFSGCPFFFFNYEAFIARFNNDCQLTYSSLFGGCGNDQANDIVVDKLNNKVFIVGHTQAVFDNALGLTCVGNQAGFPVCDLGGSSFFQGGLNGNSLNSGPFNDGFIARFNTINMRMEASTFFGGNSDDFITGIDLGNNSEIYVSGITLTSSSEDVCSIGNGTQFFPTCGTLPLSFGGGADNFIAKFDAGMNFEWSTYFGGVSNEKAVHIYLPDGTLYGPKIVYSSFHDKVFIQGITETGSASIDDIPLQSNTSFFNAQGSHNDPGSNRNTDCFIAGFLPNGTFDYANYYGGTGFKSGSSNPRLGDIAGGISAINERIYICGGTYSSSNFPLACPISTNPYCIDYSGASISSSNSDGYVAQIYNNPFLSVANQVPPVTSALIYPNPASSSFTVEYNSLNYSNEIIEIYSLLGEIVSSYQINTIVGKNKTEIDCSILTEGLYFVSFKNSGISGKIIIQK